MSEPVDITVQVTPPVEVTTDAQPVDLVVTENTPVQLTAVEQSLDLALTEGSPIYVTVGQGGPQGPPGSITEVEGTGDKHFEFTQTEPEGTWTIKHNLGKHPSVQSFDMDGEQIIGAISHTSTDELTITFTPALAGVAYLN